MRLEWIDEQLKARNKPRRWLAECVPNLTESKLSLVMKGERKLSSDEADSIRRVFGYRMPDDPAMTLRHKLEDALSQLDDHQIKPVTLYLEALAGAPGVSQQAS